MDKALWNQYSRIKFSTLKSRITHHPLGSILKPIALEDLPEASLVLGTPSKIPSTLYQIPLSLSNKSKLYRLLRALYPGLQLQKKISVLPEARLYLQFQVRHPLSINILNNLPTNPKLSQPWVLNPGLKPWKKSSVLPEARQDLGT